MGFGSLQRNQTRRSLRRFTSPSPSTLRGSHPHSGLIPPGPCGFVSRHIRPWDSAFDVFPTRSAVTPFDVRCSRAVSAGGHPPLPRLRSVTPTERPFTLPPRLSDCRGRYAHDLSPSEATPTRPLSFRSPPMHLLARCFGVSIRPSLRTTARAIPASGVCHLPASNITNSEEGD